MAIELNKGIDIPKEAQNQNVLDSETPENGVVKKKRLFANPFSFHGRIRRLEFGLSYLIFLFVYIIVDGLTGENEICGLLFIPLYWFLWAQGAKRCHDRGNTGWFQIIPFYGLWMLFGDGEPHENDYGTDPKGRDIVE